MRYVTPSTDALLQTKQGTELMLILEVQWADGTTLLYSDQDIDGAKTAIISMGGFDTSLRLTGSSDSQSISVVLDDIDGHLKGIYNSTDVHKRPASVHAVFKGLPITERFLLFDGEIVTPFSWDESERAMSFTVLSKLEAKQVGFSMEEGDFPNIPEEALGKAWPLVFGQVCHLPAVKVRAPRRGFLETGVGISDFTLDPRICQAINIQCPSQATGNQQFLFRGADNAWSSSIDKTIGPDLECVNRRFGEICKLKDLKEQQTAYEYSVVTIYNGVSFPQSTDLTLFVDNAKFRGYFSGNVFTINNREHPDFATFNHVACRDVPEFSYGNILGLPQIGGSQNATQGAGGYWLVNQGQSPGQGLQSATWVPDGSGTLFSANQNNAQAFASCDAALVSTPGMVGGPKDSWAYYDAMEASSFFWAPAGSEVYIEAESEILYIASLLPGTVDGVAAFRTAANGFRYLTEVPSSRYTVYEEDYQGYQVVQIGLNKALSLYDDSWEDQIYVSFTSSVGPNPCDIIEWLVNKYTDLTVDSTTFTTVKSYLTNYPQNFYLTDRKDVYELIQDIAYQARCAVYIRNNQVFIDYLSREPSSVRTITKSDILFGEFKESLSDTEEVYTTHNISWQTGGAAVRSDQSVERKIILKYNVDKYGTVEQDWDYYTHNIYENALKSSTFWLIRKANSWKVLDFSLPLRHLDLDVGDCITLDFDQFGDPVKCLIEQSTFNPDDNTISLRVWTPIRSGETEPYYWAWPSQQSAVQTWPLGDDTHGGAGYDFEVTPPIDSILLGGAHRDDQIIITTGDEHPSDLDDTLLSPACELSDYINFNETPPEIVAKEIAESAARAGMETNMTGGGNAGGGETKKRSIDECGAGNAGCNYKVTVQWHTSSAQGQASSRCPQPSYPDCCGGPCVCSSGCPSCFGPIWSVCHTFGSPGGATSFAGYMRGNYGKNISAYWNCQETGVLYAIAANGTHSPGSGDCGEVGSETANDGETPTEEVGEPVGQTGAEPE